MKILVINDPHVALTPPRGCRPVYTEDVFSMLLDCAEYAHDLDIDVTIFTGDWFHSKMNTAHRIVRRSVDILKGWHGRKLFIAGNHDLGAEGLKSIPNQPLGVLFEAGVCEWLREDTLVYEGQLAEGIVLKGSMAVQFSPMNWKDDITADDLGLVRHPNADWAIKVTHADLMPPRKEPYPWDVLTYDQLPTDGIDLWLNGHIHNNMGLRDVGDCTFANLGSIGRVARDDYNYQKNMEVLLVTLTKDEMTFDKLPLKSALPPEELYYAKAGPDVELDAPMARFAKSIEKMLAVEESSVDDMLAVIAIGVEKPVVKAVKKHLEVAGWV